MWSKLRNWAEQLKQDTLALWFVIRDGRTPHWIRALGVIIVAYALSPIDLIPDFIPVFGYLDELILLPAGLWLMIRFTPPTILAECRTRATEWLAAGRDRPRSKLGAAVVILIWVTLAWWLVALFSKSAGA